MILWKVKHFFSVGSSHESEVSPENGKLASGPGVGAAGARRGQELCQGHLRQGRVSLQHLRLRARSHQLPPRTSEPNLT